MAQLPLQQDFSLLQTKWKGILDPIIGNPIIDGNILKDIQLKVGVNSIGHKLGRVPQGWYLVDINGAASIYRSQPFNELTLTLTSSAAVAVRLAVF